MLPCQKTFGRYSLLQFCSFQAHLNANTVPAQMAVPMALLQVKCGRSTKVLLEDWSMGTLHDP